MFLSLQSRPSTNGIRGLADALVLSLQTLSQVIVEEVGVVAEKEIRSYKSERVQRVTIYNERDNKPHLSAAQLAETTEKGDHVEKCTQALTDLNPH